MITAHFEEHPQSHDRTTSCGEGVLAPVRRSAARVLAGTFAFYAAPPLPLAFKRSKTKELLALLVDRRIPIPIEAAPVVLKRTRKSAILRHLDSPYALKGRLKTQPTLGLLRKRF